MTDSLRIDRMDDAEARAALTDCCGAPAWVDAMLARRPFGDLDSLLAAAEDAWRDVERDDVLAALACHPRIGGDIDALRQKYGSQHLDWSSGEQQGVEAADEATLEALRDGNLEYERRFGHIFVVCATGKSAREMLDILRARIENEPDDEWRVAAREQAAITRIRLHKLETA